MNIETYNSLMEYAEEANAANPEPETVDFCLFEGRHNLPPNEGPLYKSFDFGTYRAEPTPNVERVITLLTHHQKVRVYVTGFTPALTQFLSEVRPYVNLQKGGLTLMHYDKELNSYFQQDF